MRTFMMMSLTSISSLVFTSIAELINGFYDWEIVSIDEDCLVARDARTAFVLESALRRARKSPVNGDSAKEPRNGFGRYANKRYISIKGERGQTEALPSEDRSDISETGEPRDISRKNISDRRLAQLVAILYFRAKGYVVQRPLGGHWGGDELVAWKSPAVVELAECGLIPSGCLFEELLNLRWLGKITASGSSLSPSNDLAFLTTVDSLSQAIGARARLSQRIATSWRRRQGESSGDGGASGERIYLCLPLSSARPGRVPAAEDLIGRLEERQLDDDAVGLIILEPGRLTLKESSESHNSDWKRHIERYEMNLKRALLHNFRVDEIFDFMEKLDVEFCRDFEDQILWEFDEKLMKLDAKVIASELMAMIDEDNLHAAP